ncbi:DoxX family protein [Streptomyces sp. 4N509B]|uniref:DoxX family protein n=1 Tax=Streptomyces sp. 4N509B TaxID=3457413 RepID=UPI003FD19D78
MDVLVLIGRVLFAALFLNSAVGHLTHTQAMAGYAASKKVPSPKAAVLASGVVQGVGALMILLGVWPDLGALLLVLFLVPTAVLMHDFWAAPDGEARQNEMIQFLKDIALAGAALMLMAFFAHVDTDLGLTLTGSLFSID